MYSKENSLATELLSEVQKQKRFWFTAFLSVSLIALIAIFKKGGAR